MRAQRRILFASPSKDIAELLPGDGVASTTLLIMADEWTISHFSQSNPSGKGQGDVSALLRRVADQIESLGDVQVQDVTFASQPTEGEDDLTVTVYYHRQPRRR